MFSRRSRHVVFFYSPGGSGETAALGPSAPIFSGFCVLCAPGRSWSCGDGNLQTAFLGEARFLQRISGVPGAAGKLRNAPCPHTATSGWARILEFGIPQRRDGLNASRHWEWGLVGGVSKRSRDPPWNCWDNDWKLGVAQGESRGVPALLCFPPLLVEMASHQEEETGKLGKKWPELTIPTHPPPGAAGWISLKAAGNRESLNLWQQVFPPLSTAR